MSKYKCQVCDGPIVNGRCTWCGMPYRNDEVLYHLNENRSDHYRHATPKARAELRESQIPLGDKMVEKASMPERAKMQSRQPVPGKNPVFGSGIPGRAEYAAGPSKYKTPTVGEYTSGSTRKSSGPPKYSEKKKSSAGLVIAVIVIICSLLPNLIEYVKNNYSYELSSVFRSNVDTDDMQAYYFLTKGDGKVIVEDWFPEGEYVAEIDEGYATLELEHGGATQQYNLTGEDPQAKVTLRHGDTISLQNVDLEGRYAAIYLAKEIS